MYLVDMHKVGNERYFMIIDTLHPERNRLEKVSDERFVEFLQKVLDTEFRLSDLAEEHAV